MVSSNMVKFDVESTGKDVLKTFEGEAKGKTCMFSARLLVNGVFRINLLNHTVVLTGPSKGSLGAEFAITIAAGNPKQIVLAGRNKSKITPVIAEIQHINPLVEVTFVALDLGDNSSVRKAAERIKNSVSKIDGLLNSAGIMAVRNYKTSADGLESHFVTNCLGHFLLTNLLMEKLIAAHGTVINVTSTAYIIAEANTDDPNFEVSEP